MHAEAVLTESNLQELDEFTNREVLSCSCDCLHTLDWYHEIESLDTTLDTKFVLPQKWLVICSDAVNTEGPSNSFQSWPRTRHSFCEMLPSPGNISPCRRIPYARPVHPSSSTNLECRRCAPGQQRTQCPVPSLLDQGTGRLPPSADSRLSLHMGVSESRGYPFGGGFLQKKILGFHSPFFGKCPYSNKPEWYRPKICPGFVLRDKVPNMNEVPPHFWACTEHRTCI